MKAWALGKLGGHDERCSERALPVFVELVDRDLWSYKVEEIMASQHSPRVRSFLRAYQTASLCRFSDLLGNDDLLSIDLDELHQRAEEWRKKVEHLGLG